MNKDHGCDDCLTATPRLPAVPRADDSSGGSLGPIANRSAMADLIAERLRLDKESLRSQYLMNATAGIGWFVIDDLLPAEIAQAIYLRFPAVQSMRLKRSLAEHKHIAAQMDHYDILLEEAVYAFQDPRVVASVGQICGISAPQADEHLYAGGISMMGLHQYLNPHLDNSHDKDRRRWRVLNLLYYVTPDWPHGNGGDLELWPDWPKGDPARIHSRFNRLVVMATHRRSWHSVSPITEANLKRCCVSNYYFSNEPLMPGERFHITTFRGRPEQPIRNALLRADSVAKSVVAKTLKGLITNNHVYLRRPKSGSS